MKESHEWEKIEAQRAPKERAVGQKCDRESGKHKAVGLRRSEQGSVVGDEARSSQDLTM